MAVAGKKYSNYSGFLLRIGDYIVPTDRFVAAESYEASVNMQDVDPWTDENGFLHRNAIDLKALSVSFNTPGMLTDDELSEFLANIDNNIIDKTENGCYITAYIPRINDYVTQYGYMTDIQPQLYGVFDGVIKYNPIQFSFVGGVFND